MKHDKKSMLPRPAVGVGVFIWKNGKFLLGQRKNVRGAGTWSVPGGHMEGGESFEQTGTCPTRARRGMPRRASFTIVAGHGTGNGRPSDEQPRQ